MKSTSSHALSLSWRCALVAIGLLSFPPAILATPYASSLTNNLGTLSFRLNESADNVKVISGAGVITNDLGGLGAGLHTFNLGIVGPYQIVVFKAAAAGFITPIGPNRSAVLQISTDGNLVRFFNPRGLAVNTDPASPYFGRVYVANGQAGTTTTGSRAVGDGIYLLNADLSDAVGQGNTARTGGLDFATGGTVSPYRISVGQDGNLYIADWSDSTGSLYRADPDVSGGSGTNILGGPTGSALPVGTNRYHGSIAAAVAVGSLATADLAVYVIDEDLQLDRVATAGTMLNSLWRHDIGGTLPGPEVMPTLIGSSTTNWLNFVSQTMDLSRGSNGYFYVNNYRSAGTDRAGLYVLDPDGNQLWNSLTIGGSPDLLRATGGGAVSPSMDYVALINIETNGITLVPLINGIPDLAGRLQFHGMGTTTAQGRDVAFDAAGNLYAISQGAQLLRVFSPGGTTTATTGSDATFNVVRPPTSVSVATLDGSASEAGPDTGSFTITRTGDTTDPLTVHYTLTGSATNGADYVTNVLSVTIPGGAASADVVITPIDDAVTELTEDVVITLVGSADYDLRSGIVSASFIILDNEPATFIITSTDTNIYEGLAADTAGFTITRMGDTNVDIFNFEIRLLGMATVTADYTPPANFTHNVDLGTISIPIPAGVISVSGLINVKDDHNYEGDETIVLEITAGSGEYVIGNPGSLTTTLRDNECPPAAVLFSDNFETDTSLNWIVQFGANNGIFDATTNWAIDYSIFGIPPAPHSVNDSQRGLLVTVNKNDSSLSSAGINLYPANQSFSGDFALRFDLYISVGSSNQTEHTLAGINHSGMNTNRVRQVSGATTDAPGADGIWFAIEAAAGNLRDYGAYTSTNAASTPALIATRAASTLTGILQRPPYTFAGSPGNASNSVTKSWADVEVSQMSNIVTLKVNKSTILQVTNTYGFNSGNIMIGYNDQFDSRGAPFNFAIFDNVQVVRLGIVITSIQLLSGNMVQIDFFSSSGGQAGDFTLESTGDLNSSWGTESGAVITLNESSGGFRAVVTQAAGNRFYRLRR